jgi:hypothetical protein
VHDGCARACMHDVLFVIAAISYAGWVRACMHACTYVAVLRAPYRPRAVVANCQLPVVANYLSEAVTVSGRATKQIVSCVGTNSMLLLPHVHFCGGAEGPAQA